MQICLVIQYSQQLVVETSDASIMRLVIHMDNSFIIVYLQPDVANLTVSLQYDN